jgi:hypothetical protein
MDWNESDGRASLYDARGELEVELDIVNDSVLVHCQSGSGYMRESTSCYIPIDILKRLLANAKE